MNTPKLLSTQTLLSAEAKEEFSRRELGPLFQADWVRTVFIHFAVEPQKLQPWVPFPLDLYGGWAYVSLVAFTLERMRVGPLPETLTKPFVRGLSPCRFLNVRTYVKGEHGLGIYFLAEWLSNRFAVPLGPPLFGLPYRLGQLSYRRNPAAGTVSGSVASESGHTLLYSGTVPEALPWDTAAAGSEEEFLLERYIAYTERQGLRRYFRVRHEPWRYQPLDLELQCATLLQETGTWCRHAQLAGAHYSPGVLGVGMGMPHRLAK